MTPRQIQALAEKAHRRNVIVGRIYFALVCIVVAVIGGLSWAYLMDHFATLVALKLKACP